MNNKSLSERINKIMDRGPEKWLSRSLSEDAIELGRQDSQTMMSQTPKRTDVPTEKPQTSVSSGMEGGSSSNNDSVDRPPQFSFSTDKNSDQFKNAESIIENLETNIDNKTGTSSVINNKNNLLAALKDPKRREKAVHYLQVMNQQDEAIRNKREAMSSLNPDDDSEIVQFLQDHMGFRYSDGGLILPDEHNTIKRAFSQGLKNPNQKGSRYLSRQAFRQLFDPQTREILKSNNLQEIAKNALKNGIPISKELSDEIFKLLKHPSEYQNWAKEQGVAYLDPEDDIDMDYERLPNPETGELEFTGMTGLDLLKKSDPESYYQQFSNNPRGMGRGKHLFHKNLITMGGDYVTGADEIITPKRGTVDHIVSAGNRDADARDIESPLNLGVTGSGTNFHKVDMGDDPSDLVEYSEKYDTGDITSPKVKGVAGLNKGLGRQLAGQDDESKDNFWLINRLIKSDFDEPKEQFTEMPPIEDFVKKQYNFNLPNAKQDADPENRFIKKFLDNPRGANKIGQNLANITTYYPREDHSNRKMTSWSGNPMRDATNWGEYKALHNFKLGLGLPGAYNDFSEFDEIERQIREDVMSGRSKDKEKEIAKRIEAAKSAHNRRRWQSPIQARGAAWTTGLIDNDTYLNELRGLNQKARQFGNDMFGNQVNELFDRGESDLDAYESLIGEQWPEGKLPSVVDNPGWFDAMIDKEPVKKLASSRYGRSVLPREIVDKFDSMFAAGNINKKGISEFNPEDESTYNESNINLIPNSVL